MISNLDILPDELFCFFKIVAIIELSRIPVRSLIVIWDVGCGQPEDILVHRLSTNCGVADLEGVHVELSPARSGFAESLG